MEYTTNLNLKKPTINEYYNVTEQENANMDIIDEAVGKLNNDVGTEELTTEAQDCKGAINELNKNLQYSSEEINTGKKWLDGKTIYRKSFSGTYSNGTTIIDNISEVIFFSGTLLKASVKRIMPYYEYYNGGQFVGTLQLQTDGKLNLIAVSSGQSKTAKIDITIEYTRLVD